MEGKDERMRLSHRNRRTQEEQEHVWVDDERGRVQDPRAREIHPPEGRADAGHPPTAETIHSEFRPQRW